MTGEPEAISIPTLRVGTRGWRQWCLPTVPALLRRPRLLLALGFFVFLLVLCGVVAGRYVLAVYHLKAGRELVERYHSEEARPHLEACLRLCPANGEVLLLMARGARRTNAPETAGQYLERYRQRHGQTDELTLEEVLHIAAQGEVERVSNYCRHHLEQDEAAAPLILEAVAQGYLRYYRLGEVYPILQDWLKRRPEDTQALLFLAGIHALLRQHPQAVALYRQILQFDPDHELARQRLASVLMEDRKHDEALPLLEQFRHQNPNDARVQVQLACCRYHMGQQDEAEQLLDEVLTQQPHFVPALVERGRLALVRGQTDRAEVCLREAMTLAPNNRPLLYQLIHCLEQKGEIAEAESLNQQLKQLEHDLNRLEFLTIQEMPRRPNDPALQHELGQILLNTGQVEEGLRSLHRILQSHPDHFASHRTLADYYQRVGDVEQAAHHRRFLRKTPSSVRVLDRK